MQDACYARSVRHDVTEHDTKAAAATATTAKTTTTAAATTTTASATSDADADNEPPIHGLRQPRDDKANATAGDVVCAHDTTVASATLRAAAAAAAGYALPHAVTPLPRSHSPTAVLSLSSLSSSEAPLLTPVLSPTHAHVTDTPTTSSSSSSNANAAHVAAAATTTANNNNNNKCDDDDAMTVDVVANVVRTHARKPHYPASTASSASLSSRSSTASRAATVAGHYGKAAAAALRHSRAWRSVVRLVDRVIPYGGLVSNCFSLSSVTLGGGIISMPSSFATSGVVMAIVYLVIIAVLTVYTMLVMGYVMQRTHARTFEQTATLLAGPRWGYFVGFVLWISCIGAAIAYVSAVSSLLYPIVQRSPRAPAYLKSESGNRVLTSLVWLCCMLPFVIPKRVNSIRYMSAVGCSMVVYFVVMVVVHSCTHGLHQGMRGDMRYVTTGNKALYGLSIFMFAYLCQAMSQPVYYEMRPRPSIRQLTLASAVAVTVCTLLYILAGFFGYMDFGDDTRDSILYNFDPAHQPYVMVAYIGMLVKLCAAYAVNMIPCRNVVYHCLHWDLDTLPYWKHAAVVLSMSLVVLLCGLFVPSVNTAFGLVGSLCGGFTGFIFPALLYMYCGNWSRKTVGWGNYIGTYVLLISGVIAICFGTVATVYSSFVDVPP